MCCNATRIPSPPLAGSKLALQIVSATNSACKYLLERHIFGIMLTAMSSGRGHGQFLSKDPKGGASGEMTPDQPLAFKKVNISQVLPQEFWGCKLEPVCSTKPTAVNAVVRWNPQTVATMKWRRKETSMATLLITSSTKTTYTPSGMKCGRWSSLTSITTM